IGLGCALASKLDKKQRYVYVLLGDGELNEGAIWEAAMAAAHYKLDNLIAIIDRNGIQIDGSTEEIIALEPLAEKWKSFGWVVIEVDGSKISDIINGFNRAKEIIMKPKVIISYLIKGSDISFMEHTKKYHGRPPNREEYEQAIKELELIKKQIIGD
ncbi:MAG: thiamine pyrophosphate-dependent enzyme, partial [Promethearchaeota archaeon]